MYSLLQTIVLRLHKYDEEWRSLSHFSLQWNQRHPPPLVCFSVWVEWDGDNGAYLDEYSLGPFTHFTGEIITRL